MQWLNNIATKTAALREVSGVQLSLNRDGSWQVCYVVLKQKKQQLLLERKGMLPWEEFLVQHAKDIPVALSIDGKGILTKSWTGGAEVSLPEILPNAAAEDFYFNALSSNTSWISLSRRAVVDEVVLALSTAGISVVSVQLGPLGVVNLCSLLPDAAEMQLPHWRLEQQDGQLVSLSPEPAERNIIYQLGEESLEAAYLQPYANALAALLSLDTFEQNNLKDVQLLWLHKRLYKRLGVGMLAFFFGLLLLNFGLFSYLSTGHQELSGRLQQQQHLLGQLQTLRKQEESRQQLLKAVPLRNQTLFAYHADLLAATVPAGIQLEEVKLHPEEGRKNKQQALRFQHGLIEVKGQCSNPVLLNRWLETLEKEPWVKAVKNQRYSSSAAGHSGSSFGFTLALAAP